MSEAVLVYDIVPGVIGHQDYSSQDSIKLIPPKELTLVLTSKEN